VRDFGAGIPEQFRARMFEKFAQADATDARQKGGTGLGLSIVKQIVTLLGGTITFESVAGVGTTFRVDLPSWELADAEASSEHATGQALQLLLVDDDATVLDLVRETLEGCGYSIDTVTNSQDAIARVKGGGYSMIILDLLLPDMNGFILAQEIKRVDPHLSDRILFISGILFGQSTVDHLGSVGAGFLSKPFQLESLIEAVDRIAKKRVA